MKEKLVVLSLFAGVLIFSCFMVLSTPTAGAQDMAAHRAAMEERWGAGNVSDLYYINSPVEKVYPYRLGYVVLFRKGLNELGTAYIPFEWFRASVGKAELIHLRDGPVWPSISVFYRDGEFHSVKLYVARRPSHITWGIIPSNVNLDARFEGVETIDLSHNADAQ